MRAAVLLATRAERSAWWREAVYAFQDGAHWAWAAAVVAAATVWVARGMPSPVTAGAAAVVMPIGATLGAARAWRRYSSTDPAEGRAAARTSWRRWLTAYATAAAVIPAVMAGAVLPVGLAVVALAELAILTIPWRARRRLLYRIRIGAAAVAGDEEVEVGRALWSGRHLDQIHIRYPVDWAAHRPGRRDELVERAMWDLCGPPPRTPAEAIARPDYLSTFNHVETRLEIERVPSLPHRLAARNWDQREAIVAGQTTPDVADAVIGGVPVALYRPKAHALIVGATQHGKSSGVRAWVVDGLTHGVFPGGMWGLDGKGSGSLAPLIGRQGVHAIAHSPEEWRAVLAEDIAPTVARRYAEILAWRSGQSDHRPDHPRAVAILDEIQQILFACPDLADTLNTLARQALEANVLLWVLTQRPDAADAVPGAVRDQLVDRITFGPLSGSGAKMSFDIADDWHRAMGVAPIPGRALTWLGGLWRPVQAPWLPIPADDPRAEPLYPPRASQRSAAPPAPPARPDDRQADPNPGAAPAEPAPVIPQVEEIVRDYGTPSAPPPSAAYDPTDPYAHRRRRRRRD
ncbi:hypothetical protein NE236_42970 [Actinoallomurus purpureus]|uniref:hypothetical protein n=1 Tax=Actinoallomurus purpureus TaxID=478114 RepID=UPI0020938A53|nr:hypothetical protein [Actinoallomurus purpureus]MCO6011730.1 hypothetical protein [Actinoallomurus purpureus]